MVVLYLVEDDEVKLIPAVVVYFLPRTEKDSAHPHILRGDNEFETGIVTLLYHVPETPLEPLPHKATSVVECRGYVDDALIGFGKRTRANLL